MYAKILVPVDGSPTATLGLREALKLAKAHGAQIRLIHVVDELAAATAAPAGNELVLQLRSAGASILEEAAAAARHAHVAVDTKLIEITGGRAGAYIVQEAQTWPADLIVCGTHGRHGIGRVVMGSDAEDILRHSPVPVLLVPSHPAPAHERATVGNELTARV
jgi:nucleotide-binding universal stress UspA family protein